MEYSAEVSTLATSPISTLQRPYGPSSQVDIGLAAHVETLPHTPSLVGFVYVSIEWTFLYEHIYNKYICLMYEDIDISVLRVCSVLFDYRVETEISICLETQKLLSQGPLIGQHSQLSSLHIRVTQGQGVGALVNAIFTLPVWVHS